MGSRVITVPVTLFWFGGCGGPTSMRTENELGLGLGTIAFGEKVL